MPTGVYIRRKPAWNKGKTNVYTEDQLERIRVGTTQAMKNPVIRMKISNGLKRKFVGENHPRWVGDKITKKPVHQWVVNKLGKPHECENCGDSTRKHYQWANLSGEYKRDISDWVRLYVPCHSRFDNYIIKGWRTRIANQNRG